MATTTFRKTRVSRELLAAIAAVGAAFVLGGATGYVAKQGASQPAGGSTRNAVTAPAAVGGGIDRSAVRRLGQAAPGFADPAVAAPAALSGPIDRSAVKRLGQAAPGLADPAQTLASGAVYQPASRLGGTKI